MQPLVFNLKFAGVAGPVQQAEFKLHLHNCLTGSRETEESTSDTEGWTTMAGIFVVECICSGVGEHCKTAAVAFFGERPLPQPACGG